MTEVLRSTPTLSPRQVHDSLWSAHWMSWYRQHPEYTSGAGNFRKEQASFLPQLNSAVGESLGLTQFTDWTTREIIAFTGFSTGQIADVAAAGKITKQHAAIYVRQAKEIFDATADQPLLRAELTRVLLIRPGQELPAFWTPERMERQFTEALRRAELDLSQATPKERPDVIPHPNAPAAVVVAPVVLAGATLSEVDGIEAGSFREVDTRRPSEKYAAWYNGDEGEEGQRATLSADALTKADKAFAATIREMEGREITDALTDDEVLDLGNQWLGIRLAPPSMDYSGGVAGVRMRLQFRLAREDEAGNRVRENLLTALRPRFTGEEPQPLAIRLLTARFTTGRAIDILRFGQTISDQLTDTFGVATPMQARMQLADRIMHVDRFGQPVKGVIRDLSFVQLLLQLEDMQEARRQEAVMWADYEARPVVPADLHDFPYPEEASAPGITDEERALADTVRQPAASIDFVGTTTMIDPDKGTTHHVAQFSDGGHVVLDSISEPVRIPPVPINHHSVSPIVGNSAFALPAAFDSEGGTLPFELSAAGIPIAPEIRRDLQDEGVAHEADGGVHVLSVEEHYDTIPFSTAPAEARDEHYLPTREPVATLEQPARRVTAPAAYHVLGIEPTTGREVIATEIVVIGKDGKMQTVHGPYDLAPKSALSGFRSGRQRAEDQLLAAAFMAAQ